MIRLAALLSFLCVPSSAALAPLSEADFAASVSRVNLQARTLSSRFIAASTWMQDREIVNLLRDREPSVRIAALKYARSMPQIQSWEVRREVASMTVNDPELDVRVEAVRTLYWVSGYSETQRLLFDLARADGSPRVRAMAYKALHSMAPRSSSIWRDMMVLARGERDLEARKAAVWALFECGGQNEVRDALLRTAADPRLDLGLRVEAVKSLYGAMGYSEITREMVRLAENASQPKDLRLAGILALSGVNSSEASRTIERLIRDADPAVRAAAVKAAGGLTEELRRFFHLGYRLNNQYISPIENE